MGHTLGKSTIEKTLDNHSTMVWLSGYAGKIHEFG